MVTSKPWLTLLSVTIHNLTLILIPPSPIEITPRVGPHIPQKNPNQKGGKEYIFKKVKEKSHWHYLAHSLGVQNTKISHRKHFPNIVDQGWIEI